MNKSWKLFGSTCLPPLLLTMLLFGCEKEAAPSAQPTSEPPIPSNHTVTLQTESSPNAQAGPEASASPIPEDEHAAQVSANSPKTDASPGGQAPSATIKPNNKPKVDAKDAYKEEKPTLMGLSIGADKTIALAKFGTYKNQFIMDEDEETITVYEYADFSIGFNAGNKLEFVDVHSPDIDPGLGGLRLGQKTEDAVAILGKPDQNTTYVLSYKAQGTVLKIDIDPKQNTIQSIKLFAER